MCGIFGYIGRDAVKKALDGIKGLEYRGYDSAGIAIIDDKINLNKIDKNLKKNVKKCDKNMFIIKNKGEIKHLETILNEFDFSANIAIAHTRWATHGKANIVNSHPHCSKNGKWAIVHNGIIHNYLKLKENIDDVDFSSETDTEVVAHLLEKYYKGNPLETVRDVCVLLDGSYAFAVICSDYPNQIFVARKNSPAVVGCGEGYGVVCSDLNSVGQVEKVYLLEEENIAVVKEGSVDIYDFSLNNLNKQEVEIDTENDNSEDESYPHYMIKEINEIPKVLQKTIEKYQKNDDFSLKMNKICLKNVENLLIIGCGTAFNAGRIGGDIIEKECKIKVDCFLSSEFVAKEFLVKENSLAIFISQSGETADTLKAVKRCKVEGVKTLAITNVKNSSIERLCDFVLYTYAGKEVAVASTKAFNCQVAVLYLFSAYLKSLKNNEDFVNDEFCRLKQLVGKIEKLDNDVLCKEIALQIKNEESVYMIGRSLDYLLAEESSLKLKEISYIHSEALPAGELKHGTISLIDQGTYVFAFATQKDMLSLMKGNIKEVESRGAKVIVFSPYDMHEDVYNYIKIEKCYEKYFPILTIVYMQKIAYYTSLLLGHNPDKPRSLAKSVTVE